MTSESSRTNPASKAIKPRIAVVGAGGTISTLSALGSLDLVNYMAFGSMLSVEEVISAVPEAGHFASIAPVAFNTGSSTSWGYREWHSLVKLIHRLEEDHGPVDGIVILHGTGTLEETAYFLNLCLKTPKPVVLTGSQRPLSAISSDAPLNLVNALRVAGSAGAQGMGVLVCLNDEIHAARDVVKGATSRLNAFRTPDFGVLGEVNGDGVNFYRRPVRRSYPETEFDIASLETLPRVDIAYSYAGEDGQVVRALVAAGAKGLVVAGFPGGRLSPAQRDACQQALDAGVAIVVSTRAGSGRAHLAQDLTQSGMVAADNLSPQKARILLALALTVSREKTELERIFAYY
ncbi:asparaginase [Ottowia thiooxydans]|uniref:L-asparaginase n=1 Tax=Ottowia thiooxydans TaxID=219182 RepID=A0ABV2Q5P8_9BURK